MDLHLRRATANDAPAVAEVYVASWNKGFADLMPTRILDRSQVSRWETDLVAGSTRWWLAESHGSVVGFTGTGPSRDPVEPDLGELETIAVEPSLWRRGVGRRLMEIALDELRGTGHRAGILWTLADYERGRTFYEATGWRASGEVRDSGRQIAFRRPPRTPSPRSRRACGPAGSAGRGWFRDARHGALLNHRGLGGAPQPSVCQVVGTGQPLGSGVVPVGSRR